jgi:hypothetical protein
MSSCLSYVTVTKLTGESQNRSLCIAKARDGIEGTIAPFQLPPIQLGEDEDGDPVFGNYVLPTNWSPAHNSKKHDSLSSADKIALRALHEAVDECGEIPLADNHIPANTKCVRIDTWREYAYRRGISDGEGRAKQAAFKRTREKLTAQSKVGIYEPWAWPIFRPL